MKVVKVVMMYASNSRNKLRSYKITNLQNYQNFHQGFLAAALLLSAAPVAALVTLSFRRPFLSQLIRYRTRQ